MKYIDIDLLMMFNREALSNPNKMGLYIESGEEEPAARNTPKQIPS